MSGDDAGPDVPAGQDLARIKALLAAHGLTPRHRFGQNFLCEPSRVARLVDAAGVGEGDLVLEVGPGTGALTEVLLARGCEVVACELDRGMAGLIEQEIVPIDPARLTLVQGDCLGDGRTLSPDIDAVLAGRPFTLVANLPYQAASPLMAHLALERRDCLGQFVTIQKEVVDRLAASPGSKAYGTLGVLVQVAATAKRLEVLPPGCFWPRPKVTSATAAIVPRAEAEIPAELGDSEARSAFAKFVTGLFAKRRKQLGSILGRDREWPDGIEPSMRPEAVDARAMVALWASTS